MYFGTLPFIRSGLISLTDCKLIFERTIAISPDVLHVLVGVTILFLAAALLRKSIADWRPLLVVVALQLGNELLDFHYEIWPQLSTQLGESLKDIWLTLFLPAMLMILARSTPALFVGRQSGSESATFTTPLGPTVDDAEVRG
jgi:hypothetical protein